MYAVAFDRVVADARKHHPKHDPSAAYADIYKILVTKHGFGWKQDVANARREPGLGFQFEDRCEQPGQVLVVQAARSGWSSGRTSPVSSKANPEPPARGYRGRRHQGHHSGRHADRGSSGDGSGACAARMYTERRFAAWSTSSAVWIARASSPNPW
jgi:hypothetical protein